jgi:nucleoid-associated protein YgaU
LESRRLGFDGRLHFAKGSDIPDFRIRFNFRKILFLIEEDYFAAGAVEPERHMKQPIQLLSDSRTAFGRSEQEEESTSACAGDLASDRASRPRCFVEFVDFGARDGVTERALGKPGLVEQFAKSSDVAKQRIVKLGETLSSIAAEEYLDPAMWRPIADQNGLDDPFNLVPGTPLLVPTVTLRRRGRSRT